MKFKCIKKGHTDSECSFDPINRTCDLDYNIEKCRYDKKSPCLGEASCHYDVEKVDSDKCKSVYILKRIEDFYCCHFRTPHKADCIEDVFKYNKKTGEFEDTTPEEEATSIKVLLRITGYQKFE